MLAGLVAFKRQYSPKARSYIFIMSLNRSRNSRTRIPFPSERAQLTNAPA